jgi:hypothetical protein
LLPDNYASDLIKIIKVIQANSKKSEKENWLLPFEKNRNLMKIAEYIGVEKAKSIKFNE